MVVHAYYPLGETRVEREAMALIDRGYEVDVICLRNAGERVVDTEDGVTIYRLPVKRHKGKGVAIQLIEYLSFFILAFFKLTALHLRRRYRVVQVHNLPDFLIFAALAPKLTGARLLLDLHDLMPEFYAARFGDTMTSWPVHLIRWQEKLSCRFADHVVTVTELWRSVLVERGVPDEKSSVVMNVADDRIFHQDVATNSSAPKNNHFHLIYHGSITQRYGIDLIIRAVHLVRNKIPQIHLTVHGAGEYRNALIALVEKLHLEEQVNFSTHFVPTAELPKLISEANVGVVPYRRDVFTDGILPTKLMEYVALGIPVIAARTSAIAAYFDDRMVQFFTPEDYEDLADCIVTLYHDRERMVQLAQEADKFNQRYNWKKLSAEYVDLIERLGA